MGAGTGHGHIIACVPPPSSVPRWAWGAESAVEVEGAFADSQNGTSEASGGPGCWPWAGETGWPPRAQRRVRLGVGPHRMGEGVGEAMGTKLVSGDTCGYSFLMALFGG